MTLLPPEARRPLPGVTLHAKERLYERYGLIAPPEEWLAAVLAIIDRQAVLLATLPYRARELYAVRLCGREVRVSWDPAIAAICTVLGPQHSNASVIQTVVRRRATGPAFGGPRPYHHARERQAARRWDADE